MLAIMMAAALAALPAPVSGDFDHDGKVDVATVIAVNGGYNLVIRPGDRARAPTTVETIKAGNMAGFYLKKAAPGVEATACAQGSGPRDAPCPRKSVTLTGDTLAFGAAEASRAVALWTGQRFEVVWLDD